ncbi:hypothetical protein WMZ97_14870 [Lentibacillus sp. N15]|uniref:hypothetical protein n=1 Tax=Lentibacillus songyuanensis TaxID=3136161 RepID=UPI0031BB708E
MVRALITLLLLAVFFLSGMLFGIDHGQQEKQVEPIEKTDQMEANINDKNVETIEVANEPRPDVEDTSGHSTQKLASFLGGIIKGFYEIVVMIFYQFAEIFF